MKNEAEAVPCTGEDSGGSHHWATVQVARKNGEPVNELRCIYCNITHAESLRFDLKGE